MQRRRPNWTWMMQAMQKVDALDRRTCADLTARSNPVSAYDRRHPRAAIDPASSALHHPISAQERAMQAALTRVTLASIAGRLRVYLRFGKPMARRRINARC